MRLLRKKSRQVSGQAGIDRFLSRVANASQFGLLALGTFGYFYTVVPVYEKALLDEEIAKKTIELNQKTADVERKTKAIEELTQATHEAEKKLLQSGRQVAELKHSVNSQYAELRFRLLDDFASLGRGLCTIVNKVPAKDFTNCVLESVVPSTALAAWSSQDRALMAQIVKKIAPDAVQDAKEIGDQYAQKRREIEGKKRDAEQACEKDKQGEAYKDNLKQFDIDNRCLRTQSHLLRDEAMNGMNERTAYLGLTHTLIDNMVTTFAKAAIR